MKGRKPGGVGIRTIGIATFLSILVLVMQLRGRPDQEPPLDFGALREAASAARPETEWTLYAAPRCDECADVWRLHDEARGLGLPGVGSGYVIFIDGEPFDRWEALAVECARVEGLRSAFLAELGGVGLEASFDPVELARRAGVRNVPDYEDCLAGERFLFEVEAAATTAFELAPTVPVILHRRRVGSSTVLTGREASDSLAALLAGAGPGG